MKEREALRHEINLVLTDPDTNLSHGARRALDYVICQLEALAQPEQEPVAWMRKDETCTDCFVWERTDEHTIPLYTTPPTQQSCSQRQCNVKPLTDEQIERLIFQSGGHKSTQNLMSNPMQVREHVELWNERIYKFARAIEAAHGIKE